MSTESLFGTWDKARVRGDYLFDKFQGMWHTLACQNAGKPEFQANSGLTQRKHEIIMLWTLVHFQRPQVVVEVGTAQGGSFASFCELAAPDATLISIDRCINDCRPRPGEPVHPSVYNGPLRMSEQGGGVYSLGKKGQRVYGINGWSHEKSTQDRLEEILAGRKIDFLFNDGSHSKEMFADDFRWMWPLVAEGGIFATHDIHHSKAEGCDKRVEWERIIAEETYSAMYEFRPAYSEDSLGIGVLIR